MIDFLKNFFAGEKSPEEKMLAAQVKPERDVLVVDAYAMEDDEEEEAQEYCGSPCGGCGCRS
ncbi:MAG: hypothetical protein EPN97_03735 [Alphaproteobacteria bacterium]|nr:MAG: hypothetical protein EPN97_03735 [Alphaproteobacteria bacterium]